MDELLRRLDPVQAILVAAIATLYIDSRRDRVRYQETIERLTTSYQATIREATDALSKMRAEISVLTQTIAGIRRRMDDE